MACLEILPYELRTKIFGLALPDPRVLHVIRKTPKAASGNSNRRVGSKSTESRTDGFPCPFTVSAASYGGKHPAILSVNRESRAEALKHLTRYLGVYWNMELDFPYFEIHDIRDKEAMWMTDMHNAGLMKPFHNIAIDVIMWRWKISSSTMEFLHMHGRDFVGIKTPAEIMQQMPYLTKCVLTYTDHTLQRDVVIPGQSWELGEVNAEVALDDHFEANEMYNSALAVAQGSVETPDSKFTEAKLDIQLMGIHGRQREYFPPGKRLRPPPLPSNYYDWFG